MYNYENRIENTLLQKTILIDEYQIIAAAAAATATVSTVNDLQNTYQIYMHLFYTF
tara:strand:+ start:314 stop:481 length:168 start_codon:yes stop_codon:yes gene_type:complete